MQAVAFAGHAWHRVGAAFQLILASLFLPPYARYADDLLGADPVGAGSAPAEAAALARWVIAELLGWELDLEKAREDNERMTALGVDVRVTADMVELRIEAKRASITGGLTA